jgi:hypothetical protein
MFFLMPLPSFRTFGYSRFHRSKTNWYITVTAAHLYKFIEQMFYSVL